MVYGLQAEQAQRRACFPNGIHPLLGSYELSFSW